ncbi:hypothetical protein [Arsenicibacter rosenii]|uniref:hypothetical protein n=1 Tax=Arsenicibacter rosenii TaxID=1750698 RepID=UPI001160A2E8|nr:hypothetical protein [Arsenicibacter rosenii]
MNAFLRRETYSQALEGALALEGVRGSLFTKVGQETAAAVVPAVEREVVYAEYAFEERMVAQALGIGTKVGVSSSNVLTSASSAYKGSTKLGHALSKHAQRHPEIWGKLTGHASTWHNRALIHYNEIMNSPGYFIVTENAQGIRFLEKTLVDGRGIRLNLDKTFKGFID